MVTTSSKTSLIVACIIALVVCGFITALGLMGAGKATNEFSREFGKYLAMVSMLGFIVVLVMLINVLKNRIEMSPLENYGKHRFRSF